MIEIEEIVPISGYRVDTTGGVLYRYSADDWTIVIGESEEPLYDCENMEKAFQEFKAKNK